MKNSHHKAEPSYSNNLWNAYNTIGAAIIVVEKKTGTILFVNAKVEKDLGIPRKCIEQKHYTEIFWPEFLGFYHDIVGKNEHAGEQTGIYYWTERALWEQVTVTSFTWDETDAILITITNVSEVARKDYEHKQLAFFDGVTGLPNERKLEEDINEIAEVENIRLVFFLVECISDIYDIYGWVAGDALVTSMRNWLQETKYPRTHLYRIGNTFIMMGRDISDEDLFRRARIIQKRFESPWTIPLEKGDFPIYCTARIGIVYGTYVKNEMTNIILRTLNMADKTDQGFMVYNEEAEEAVKRKRRLRNELIDSIHDNMRNFSLRYQPIVEVATKQWVGVEALCRWESETDGPISPLEFIALAEQIDLVGHLDGWVRAQAMRECSSIGLNEKSFYLNVNFSPHQPIDDALVKAICHEGALAGFPLENLLIEITETEQMEFDECNLAGIQALKRVGVLIGLDDFGTGYSSIESLIKISANILKTDKILVDDLEHDKSRQFLVQTLISVAHSFGMSIIVEGVEHQEQFDIIKKFGADYVQGYLFSPPLTLLELEKEVPRYSR